MTSWSQFAGFFPVDVLASEGAAAGGLRFWSRLARNITTIAIAIPANADAPSLGGQVGGMRQVQGDEDPLRRLRLHRRCNSRNRWSIPRPHEKDDDLFKCAGTGDGHEEHDNDCGPKYGAHKTLRTPEVGIAATWA